MGFGINGTFNQMGNQVAKTAALSEGSLHQDLIGPVIQSEGNPLRFPDRKTAAISGCGGSAFHRCK